MRRHWRNRRVERLWRPIRGRFLVSAILSFNSMKAKVGITCVFCNHCSILSLPIPQQWKTFEYPQMFTARFRSPWKYKARPSAIKYPLRISAIGDRHGRTRLLATIDELRQMEMLRGRGETSCASSAMGSPKEHKLRTHRTPAFGLQIECTKRRSYFDPGCV
jgi:hypothetical protein